MGEIKKLTEEIRIQLIKQEELKLATEKICQEIQIEKDKIAEHKNSNEIEMTTNLPSDLSNLTEEEMILKIEYFSRQNEILEKNNKHLVEEIDEERAKILELRQDYGLAVLQN